MAVPKTVRTYDLDGAIKDFTIPFEYLARKFVVVTLIGVVRQELVLNVDYRFSTSNTITTLRGAAWGPADSFDLIEIRRFTSATERLVDFADGSILRAYDLNTSQVQSLHIAEEARDLTADTIGVDNDGNLDARARRIVNVGDPINEGDAVTLRYELDHAASTLGNKVASEAARDASVAAKDLSVTARIASEAARDLANTYKGNALTSANASEVSNLSSKDWASKAEDSVVSGGLYSSYHYSRKAEIQAGLATTNGAAQVALATTQAGIATTQANNSANSATASQDSRLASEAARDLSLQYSQNAATEAANAQGVGVEFINGLIPSRHATTTTTLIFSAGSAIVPSTGKLVRVTSPITLNLLGSTVGATWHYAYLYDSGAGVGAIEVSTTAPAAPYSGFARHKTGDTSRRYIGAFMTGSSGNFGFWHFLWLPNFVMYQEAINAVPFRFGPYGQTTPITRSLLSVVPPTTRSFLTNVTSSATTASQVDAYFSTPEIQPKILNYTTAAANLGIRNQVASITDSSQNISFWVSLTGSTGTFDICGYGNER